MLIVFGKTILIIVAAAILALLFGQLLVALGIAGIGGAILGYYGLIGLLCGLIYLVYALK